jgi:hypothetical protein
MSEPRSDDVLPDDLDALVGLPHDHPRITALGPRARAQLRVYRDFLAHGEAPAGARVADAERRLGDVLERELGVPIRDGAAHAGTAAPGAVRGGPPARGSFLDLILGPRSRPVLALALVVIVAGAVWLATANRRDGEDAVMRGDEMVSEELRVTVETPRAGTVRLAWTPSPAADGYALVFLAPDLTEIARVPAYEPAFTLQAGSLPAGLTSRTPVLWRVVALRSGDEIARSNIATLIVP